MPKSDKTIAGQAQEALPASVTDYNSDEDEEVQETRKQANVALKRSKDFSTASPSLTPQASTITPASFNSSAEPSVSSTIRGGQRPNPDAASDSGYSSRTIHTAESLDSTMMGRENGFMPKVGSLDMGSINMSVGAGSDIHTVTTTSSTCDREENGSEVFVKNGKRYLPCRDPKCTRQHKVPEERSKVKRSDSAAGSSRQSETSRGSAGSPTKTRKPTKLPPKEEKEKKRREPSPKRKEKERTREPKQRVTIDTRPQLRQRSASVSDPRPRSGYYEYPIQQPMNAPPNSFFTRYSQSRGGQMLVHKSFPSPIEQPQHLVRPGMPPHRATEMSARQINPAASYFGRVPPIVRQEMPQPVISARKVSKDSQVAHSPFESEEDEEMYTSEEDDEDEHAPSLRDYERVMAAQRAANEQKRRDLEMALAMREKRQRELRDDRDKMPPPPRPTSAMKVGSTNNVHTFSMRQVPQQQRVTHNQLPPLQTRDHIPPHMQSPVLTQSSATTAPVMTREDLLIHQYRQLEAAAAAAASATMARPPINPLVAAGKLTSTPVLGSDSGSMYAEASSARQQRRPSSFYGSEVGGDMDLQNYHYQEQAYREGIRQQELQAAQVAAFERERIRLEHKAREREMEAMGYSVQHPHHPMYDDAEVALRAEAKMQEAKRHIASSSSNPQVLGQEGHLEGILRKPSHSKRSSRDTSSITDSTRNHRRQSINSATSNRYTESTITAGTANTAASHVFRTRFDPDRDFEFEIEDRVVSLRPNEDGKVELYVGGKREKKYIKSTGTNTSASTGLSSAALGRRPSKREPERRARFEDEEDEDEDEDESDEESDEEEEIDEAEERRQRILMARQRERQLQQREREREQREREAKGASRRRAETGSGSQSGSSGHVERGSERGAVRPRAKTSEAGSGASRDSRRGDGKRRG